MAAWLGAEFAQSEQSRHPEARPFLAESVCLSLYVRSNIQPVFDGFPSQEMGKRTVCNFWLYQTMPGQAQRCSAATLALRTDRQTAQLPGVAGS